MSDNFRDNLQQIKATIPPQVRLIAVTKRVSVEKMRLAYELGMRDFAENKLQEAIEKQEMLKSYQDICWHFIGHLQTNKAKKTIECFNWIHSVDSLKLAEKLNIYSQEALEKDIIHQLPQICLQVKILPDENKYGWEIKDLYNSLEKLQCLKWLKIRGLMTILPLNLSEEETLSAFQKVHDLSLELRPFFGADFNQLSMGMSGDYLLAIKAGTTMIRLGTIIFGDRSY